ADTVAALYRGAAARLEMEIEPGLLERVAQRIAASNGEVEALASGASDWWAFYNAVLQAEQVFALQTLPELLLPDPASPGDSGGDSTVVEVDFGAGEDFPLGGGQTGEIPLLAPGPRQEPGDILARAVLPVPREGLPSQPSLRERGS